MFAHIGLTPAGWAQCDPVTVANFPGLSLDIGVSFDGGTFVVRNGTLQLFKWDHASGTFTEESSEVADPHPPALDLTGHFRRPDAWQPRWIRRWCCGDH